MANLPPPLLAARRALASSGAECRNVLNRLTALQLSEQLDQRESTFRQVLTLMAEGLWASLDQYCERHCVKPPDEFYFWPGYNSLSTEDGNPRRVTHHEPDPHRDRLIPCGISRTKKFKLSATSLWYDLLLSPEVSSRTPEGALFSPGSTHLWLQQDVLTLRHDETPLEVLVVSCGKSETGPVARDGIVHITLDEDAPTSWGPSLAAQIRMAIRSSERWPRPIDPDSSSAPEFIRMREDLYTAWIAANCFGRWTERMRTWANDLYQASVDLNLVPLANSIRLGLDNAIDGPNYRTWSSFALQSAPRIPELAGSEELGSAMILTTGEIPPSAWLYFVRRWIEQVYLWMRLAETAVIVKLTAPRLQANYASHEGAAALDLAKKLLPHIGRSSILQELAESSISYGQLCMSKRPQLTASWLPREDTQAGIWIDSLVRKSWHLTIARLCLDATRLDDLKEQTIQQAYGLPIDATVLIAPDPTAKLHPEFLESDVPWDLSRWLLAALTNALRWAALPESRGLGLSDIETLDSLLLTKGTSKSPLCPLQIEIIFDRQSNTTTFSIYNASRAPALSSAGKVHGTPDSLYFIAASLPGFFRQHFGEVEPAERQKRFPDYNRGFLTDIVLRGRLFQSRGGGRILT